MVDRKYRRIFKRGKDLAMLTRKPTKQQLLNPGYLPEGMAVVSGRARVKGRGSRVEG